MLPFIYVQAAEQDHIVNAEENENNDSSICGCGKVFETI